MAKKKQFVTAAAAFAVAASAVAPAITADAASTTVRLSSDYVRGGDLNAALDKEYKGSEIHWYKSSIDMNKLGVFQTAKGFVKGKGIKVEKSLRVLNYAQDIKPEGEIVLEQGVPASGLRVQPVLFADGIVYNKPVAVAGFSTEKVGEFEGTFTYANKAYGSVTKTVKYKVVASKVAFSEVKHTVEGDTLSVTADVANLKDGEKVELVIYPGKDESKALDPIAAEVKDGKVSVSAKDVPAGTHSFVLQSGDVKTSAVEFTVEVLELKEFKAATSKTLEVQFNKAVDTSKAAFALTKDGFKSNIAAITWNEDKTVATLELTSKITKGEYALSVTGASDKALTASVKTEDEKVAGLEILSDIAPITSGTTAKVGFKIENQYGEDITKLNAAGLTVSAAGASKAEANADGSITLEGVKKDDKVVITLINGATATTTTKTVTVSAESMAADVEIGALYNKDGKTLTEGQDVTKDKFFLPVVVKDQYGKEIKDVKRLNGDGAEIILTNTNKGVVEFGEFALETINGKEVVVLPVSKAAAFGEASLILIAKSNGKNAQTSVKVAEGFRTDAVTLGAPTSIVTAGKDVYFPLTVLDKQGNAVTDLKQVAPEAKYGVKVSGGTVVLKDGSLFVKVAGKVGNANNVVEGQPVTVVVTSSTSKVATQTVIAKEAIKPRVITGLSSKVSTAIRNQEGAKVELTAKDFIVEDQYGQVIPADELSTLLTGDYALSAKVEDDAPFKVDLSTAGKVVVEFDKESKSTKTAANVTFKLGESDASAYSKKFTVVKDSEFASYKVSDVAPIYLNKGADADATSIPEGYERSIEVKAVTASGGEVKLVAGTDYTVKSSVLALTDGSDNLINGDDADAVTFAANATTATAKVTITINATGEEIVKEITFSNVAPKVEKVNVVAQGNAEAFIAGDKLDAFSAVNYTQDDAFNLSEFEKIADVVVTDQYGEMAQVDEETVKGQAPALKAVVDKLTSTLTLSKVSGDVTFKQNGTAQASASGEANAAFNARYNLNGTSASPIKITATQKFDTPE
ncbi:hypothetical protein M3591_15185 [Exiguobacterium sp. MER 193]|uniref:hypothetical protein n=1 Tax=Exiguobacterium sp. MER 193 TaxID=2939564 RepID=UPI00203D8ABA|nr:hypothetical protein [Exiguobacterium sp. MER 193]MCM3281830.1 hypothetical protein [Exiguobacterium sp. MER 193]